MKERDSEQRRRRKGRDSEQQRRRKGRDSEQLRVVAVTILWSGKVGQRRKRRTVARSSICARKLAPWDQ